LVENQEKSELHVEHCRSYRAILKPNHLMLSTLWHQMHRATLQGNYLKRQASKPQPERAVRTRLRIVKEESGQSQLPKSI
jgi:hypothetical protein